MPRSNAELDFLLAPTTAEEFFARRWEREPLVVARDEPGRFSSLLAWDDLDHVVSTGCDLPNGAGEAPAVEILGDAALVREVEARHAHRLAAAYDAYERGASLRVNGVQQFWKPLRLLCRALEQVFNFPVKANLYASPAGARSSPRHYDKHDVLVLQLAGRKHWRVYRPVVPLPLAHTPALPFEQRGHELKHHRGGPVRGRARIGDEEAGAPVLEHLAREGDTLYLPRGFVHEVWATDAASLHVTLGVHVLTWMHLLSVALGQVSNADERFRRALPVGFANETAAGAPELGEHFAELLRALAEQADAGRALEEAAWSFLVSTQSAGEGSLARAHDAAADIEAQTLLRRRPGLLLRLAFDGDNVGLASSRHTLWMPANFAAALRFVAENAQLRPAQLPGPMSDKSKLALARRLVNDGFLTTAREPATNAEVRTQNDE